MINHEILKIHAEQTNMLAFSIYVVLILFSLIKTKKNNSSFMDPVSMLQVRGLAILLVVIGHLAVHVIYDAKGFPVLGSYGVSIFFILSGYGLTRSYQKKELCFYKFIKKRFKRIMVPYWFATVVIIAIDLILSVNSYSWSTLISSFLGINFSPEARHIDYVRWYITALLIWYLIFAICWRTFKQKQIPFVIVSIGFLIVIVDYYLYPLGYNYMSFPAGVILGIYYNPIKNFFNEYVGIRLGIISVLIVILIYVILEKIIPNYATNLPSFILRILQEFGSIIISIGVICGFYSINSKCSYFLTLCGKYSYEIFLIHGPIMVRHDFIIHHGPIPVTFYIFLLTIIILAILMQKLILPKKKMLLNNG